MIIDISEDKKKYCYNKNMEWHNSYGPDVIDYDGYKTYCINGNLHNVHGPAIIYSYGEKQYWLDDKKYFKEEWKIKRHDY